MKKHIKIVSVILALMIVSTFTTSAQSILNGIMNKVKSGIKLPTGKNSGAVIRGEKSDYQNIVVSAADTAKYYQVAEDFLLDMGNTKKNYPNGYKPQWSIIGNFSQLPFTKVNYLQGKMSTSDPRSIAIDQFNSKAYVYIGGFLGCNCAARLLKDNDHVVINNNPQTFFTDDFYQINANGTVTSTPCKNMTMSYYDTGGWKMKITLSMDNSQSLLVNAVVESLTAQSNYINRNGTNISSSWSSDPVSFPNLLSAEKATATKLQKEKNEKDALARRITQEKKEKEEGIAFEASIKNSYAKVAALQSKYSESNLECIKKIEYSTYIPGSSSTHTESRIDHYDPNTGEGVSISYEVKDETPGGYEKYTAEKNTCNKTIIIKGITKLISERNTVYYADASIKLAPGETTEETIVIEDSYLPKKAQVGSTHYYRKKLTVK